MPTDLFTISSLEIAASLESRAAEIAAAAKLYQKLPRTATTSLRAWRASWRRSTTIGAPSSVNATRRPPVADPDRTLMLLREIRDDIRLMRARMDLEFSEIHDRLRRIDERMDGFIHRLEKVENAKASQ